MVDESVVLAEQALEKPSLPLLCLMISLSICKYRTVAPMSVPRRGGMGAVLDYCLL